MKNFCLFLLVVTLPLVSTAQYAWLNPLPQANSLQAVFMVDPGLGFAAGDAGTLMKTTDGGNSWEVLSKPSNQDISDLYFVDSSIGYAVGDSGLVLKTIDSGNAWETLETEVTTHLTAVFFMDELTGLVSGMDGLLMKTTDGGISWENAKSKLPADYFDLYFTDPQTGIAVGEAENGNGIVVKTINGGDSWDLVSDQIEEVLFCITFTDGNTGFAGGNFSHLIKTTDGGHTWQSVENPNQGFNYHIYDLAFSNDLMGFTCGVFGKMMKTTDGGNSWETIETALEDQHTLKGVAVSGNDFLIAAGNGGMLLRSVDQGQSFEQLIQGTSRQLMSVCHPDDSLFFVIGDGVQLKSVDAGHTWETKVFDELHHVIDAQFINPATGFAFSYDGIFKTIDSGESWFLVQPLNKAGWMNSMTMVNENLGFIMGGGQSPGGATWGTVFRTTDGSNWIEINSPASSALNDACFTSDTHGFLLGRNGQLFETFDAGDTWTTIETGTGFHLDEMCMITPTTGFIVATFSSYQNQILKTTDGGQTWQIVFSYTDFFKQVRLNVIGFYDSLNVMAAGVNGYVLKTDDGGENWQWQERMTNNWFEDILMVNGSSGLLAGAYGTLISFGDFSTGTDIEKPAIASFLEIYPNPVGDQFSMRFSAKSAEQATFMVFDVTGRQVFEQNVFVKPGSQHISIQPISHISPGVYFYLFKGRQFSYSGKIIKAER